ncbi:MAG: hypothetical protein ACRDNS_02090 [Trebonia sp.]
MTGADTGPVGKPRTEYAAAIVRSRATQITELESSEVSNERKRLILSEIIERIPINPSSRGPHFNADDIDISWRRESTA